MLRQRVRGKGVPDGWKGSDRSRGPLWTRVRRLPHAVRRGLAITCDELQTFSCRHDGEITKVTLGLFSDGLFLWILSRQLC